MFLKEIYTRGILRSITISRFDNIPTLYRDLLRNVELKNGLIIKWVNGSNPWSKKRVDYLSCVEGKGGFKDIQCIAQNAALFVDLYLEYLLFSFILKENNTNIPKYN